MRIIIIEDDDDIRYITPILDRQRYRTYFPRVCDGCTNNPKNGGSGICSCTLPYMNDSITSVDTTSLSEYKIKIE